jgi:imidazolonepropionase-like amidohydrolase
MAAWRRAARPAREQIRGGADLLKVYADWPDAHGAGGSRPTLTVEEIRVIVEEAHKGGRRVAAHAMTAAGITNNAGVDSIEHGHEADFNAKKPGTRRGGNGFSVDWMGSGRCSPLRASSGSTSPAARTRPSAVRTAETPTSSWEWSSWG